MSCPGITQVSLFLALLSLLPWQESLFSHLKISPLQRIISQD